MNDERPSGIVSGSGASASDDAEELGVQGPANSNAKNLKPSVSNITRKIRSKLPNVGRYLKRLRLRNGKLRVEKETIDGSSVAVAQNIVNEVSESSSVSTINDLNITEDGDSIWSENPVAETVWHDTHDDSSNYFSALDFEGSSASAANTSEYQTGNQTMNPTSSTLVETEPIRMISISMNTSETDGLFVTTLNRENIAARNILEFREALANPLGRPTERLRDQEPRTVPLVRIRSEDRHERYLQDNVNGESGFSRSSTIGSEISSTSDGEQPEMRNQRIGQDHTPQLYNNFLGANSVIRKPLNHQDDEPSIY
ncbi:uncharacterized protein LOC143264884 isoform X2 [Megachile rotundata]|uniref:uncharacterized protein LOC143264884 isoform X2 n=1 Tax=Megachile rotundata TaxID=143995 RepID=UPI003FD324D0